MSSQQNGIRAGRSISMTYGAAGSRSCKSIPEIPIAADDIGIRPAAVKVDGGVVTNLNAAVYNGKARVKSNNSGYAGFYNYT